ERETATGQTHEYRIKMRAGEFARVTVEQRGVDVSLKLTGPDAKQIAEVNDKKGRDESETLLLVAEAKGYYLLAVSAATEDEEAAEEKEAKEAAAAGAKRYRAEIAELRAATEKDRSRISAEREMAEADLLRAEKEPEPLKQAAAKYQEAGALFRGAGDRNRE